MLKQLNIFKMFEIILKSGTYKTKNIIIVTWLKKQLNHYNKVNFNKKKNKKN